jgi:hypothetical protein
MKQGLFAICALVLAACSSGAPSVSPVENGGNQADGIVALSSTRNIFQPVAPDWRDAEAGASKRCRNWGYRGTQEFTGSQETCSGYDRHGRCVQAVTTRFYECAG